MSVHLFIIGFISILGQVAVLRELNVAFYGIELIYLLAIGCWLLGTGAGALLGQSDKAASPSTVLLLLLLFALLLPLDIVFIRGIRRIFDAVPGAYLPFHKQIAGMLAALVPLGMILGLLFQRAAKIYMSAGKSLALAYGIESLGAVAGGLASTLFLKFGLQNFPTALWCAAISSLFVTAFSFLSIPNLSRISKYKVNPIISISSLIISIVLVIIISNSSVADMKMTRWNHPHLTASCDTPYGRVTVTSLENQTAVYENDAVSFETEGTTAEEFVQLAAVQHPRPEKILILCGGMEGIVSEALKLHPRKVDYIELNGKLLTLTAPFVPETVRRSLADEAVTVVIGDPRQMIQTSDRYDLILLGMPDPVSGQTNRFYTREFFRIVSDHLEPDGIFALRLRSAENFWPEQLTLRNASIVGALQSIFPDFLLLPGTTNLVFAAMDSLSRDPVLLSARYESRNIIGRLVSSNYIHYLYTNDRFFEINRRSFRQAPLNRDERPVCYHYALSIWLSKFFPQLLSSPGTDRTDNRSGRWYAAIAVVVIAALFAVFRRRKIIRLSLLAGLAGFGGMLLESLLILQYQVKEGVLYQDIGLLLMVFMLGMTVGALAVDFSKKKLISRRGTGVCLLVLFGLTALTAAAWIHLSIPVSLAAVCLFLGLSGFSVAAVFSYASLTEGGERFRLISPLYAADLIGGGLGTVVGSLLLIPLIGLTGTALSAFLITLLAFILV